MSNPDPFKITSSSIGDAESKLRLASKRQQERLIQKANKEVTAISAYVDHEQNAIGPENDTLKLLSGFGLSGLGGALAGVNDFTEDAAQHNLGGFEGILQDLNPEYDPNTAPDAIARRERITSLFDSNSDVIENTIKPYAKKIQRSRDLITLREEDASQLVGDAFDPSTWGFANPDQASVSGFTDVVLGTLAQQAIQFIALGGNPALRTVGVIAGAAQAGDSQKHDAMDYVMSQSVETLQRESELFNELKRTNPELSDQDVKSAVAMEAGKNARYIGAAIGGLGGSVLDKIVHGLPAKLASSAKGKAVATVGTAAISEGGTELAETVAARAGANVTTGLDRSTTEDTFGDLALGALAGGIVASPSTLGAKSDETIKEEKENDRTKQAYAEAVSTGDVTQYTDTESTDYDPTKAAQVLSTRLKSNKLSEEGIKEDKQKLNTLKEEVDAVHANLVTKTNNFSEEGVAEQDANIAREEEALANTDPDETEKFDTLKKSLEHRKYVKEYWSKASDEAKAGLVDKRDKAEVIKDNIASLIKVHENETVSTATLDTVKQEAGITKTETPVKPKVKTKAVKKAVVFAMESPENFSSEELTTLSNDESLGSVERTFLRKLAASKVAVTSAQDIDSVNQGIFNGMEGFLGLSEYTKTVTAAVKNNKPEVVTKALDTLKTFDIGHSSKAIAADQAYKIFGTTKTPQYIAKNASTGEWSNVTNELKSSQKNSKKFKEERGILEIKANSPKLVKAIAVEAEAISKTYDSLQALEAVSNTTQEEVAPLPKQVDQEQDNALSVEEDTTIQDVTENSNSETTPTTVPFSERTDLGQSPKVKELLQQSLQNMQDQLTSTKKTRVAWEKAYAADPDLFTEEHVKKYTVERNKLEASINKRITKIKKELEVYKPVQKDAPPPSGEAVASVVEQTPAVTEQVTPEPTQVVAEPEVPVEGLTKAKTELEKETEDVAGLMQILGIKGSTDPEAKGTAAQAIKAQQDILTLLKENKPLEEIRDQLSATLSWIYIEDKTPTAERRERATFKTFDHKTGKKLSEEQVAKNQAKYAKRNEGNPDRYLAMQLVEELGEYTEEALIEEGTSTTSINKLIELQKRVLKTIRFGKNTVIKDTNSPYNGKTNEQALVGVLEGTEYNKQLKSKDNTTEDFIKLISLISNNLNTVLADTGTAQAAYTQKDLDRVNKLLEESNGEDFADLNELKTTIEEALEATPVIDNRLTTFKQDKVTEDVTSENYRIINLVRKFLKQGKPKKGEVSKFLITNKDVISNRDNLAEKIKEALPKDFVLLNKHGNALRHFFGKARVWNSVLENKIFKYRIENGIDDHVQYLAVDGKLDENIYTAISLAAYNFIHQEAGKGDVNTFEDVNRMLGKDSNEEVDPEVYNTLENVSGRQFIAATSMGEEILKTLNISEANNDAPQDVLENLKTALGNYAMQLLAEQNLIHSEAIPSHKLRDDVPESSKETQRFFRVYSKDAPNNLGKVTEEITEAQTDTNSLLNKLFGSTRSIEPVMDEDYKHFTQERDKRNREISKKQKQIEKERDDQIWTIRQDGYIDFVQSLEFVHEDLIGIESTEGKHIDRVFSIKAKNAGLQRELKYILGFIKRTAIDAKFHLASSVGSNGRSHVTSTEVNPQGSKITRQLVAMNGWSNAVPTDENNSHNKLMRVAVAAGLGISVDKQKIDVSLEELNKKVLEPVFAEALELIDFKLNNPNHKFSEQEEQVIVAATKEGGLALHTTDALFTYANYLHNKHNLGLDTFTTEITLEIDGVTNGPILSQLQLGAAQNVDELLKVIEKGGMSSDGSTDNYSEWRSKDDSKDLYETFADKLKGFINKAFELTDETLQAIAFIHKNDVGEFVRNNVKTPTTSLNFGQDPKKAVQGMADDFINAFYLRIEEIAQSTDDIKEAETKELIKHFQSLTGIKLGQNVKAENLLNKHLPPRVINSIRESFITSVGPSLEEAIEAQFSNFITNRKLIDSSAKLAFTLYNEMYGQARLDYIKELIETKVMPVNKKGTPQFALTKNQEAEIAKRVEKVLPKAHNLFSQQENNLDSAFIMGKNDKVLTNRINDPQYRQKIEFQKSKNTFNSVLATGMKRSIKDPGVAMLVTLIHSLDSAISSISELTVNGLNIHDAKMYGLDQSIEGGKSLNKATFDAMAEFSAPLSIALATRRTIEGFLKLDPALLQSVDIDLAINPIITPKKGQVFEEFKSSGTEFSFLEQAFSAIDSERTKLEALLRTTVISQYSLDGSEYIVTDKDRAKVRKRLNQLAVLRVDFEATNEAWLKHLGYDIEVQTAKNKKKEAKEKAAIEAKEAIPNKAVTENGLRNQGTPIYEINQDYVELLNKTDDVKKTLLAVHKQLFFNKKNNLNAAQTRYNNFLLKLVPALKLKNFENIKIKMLDPETDLSALTDEELEGIQNRGAYVPRLNTIYIKGANFADGSVNTETIIHEILHATLHNVIDNPKKPKEKELVSELNRLHKATIKYMATDAVSAEDKELFKPAIKGKGVHELVSWGLTNVGFQNRILANVKITPSKAANKIINGIQHIVDTLTSFFTGSTKDLDKSGLRMLLGHGAALVELATVETNSEKVFPQESAREKLTSYTTQEVFNGLEAPVTPHSPQFVTHLSGLLSEVVNSVSGAYGSLETAFRKESALTVDAMYAEAVNSGELPFVSNSLSKAIKISQQEGYVIEQIEVIAREGLHNKSIYNQMYKVFQQAKNKLSPKDFLEVGTWEQANNNEKNLAKERYKAIFSAKVNADGTSNYLAEFMALALGQEKLFNKLNFKTDVIKDKTDTLASKIMFAFRTILQIINGKMTQTTAGELANVRMERLLKNMVKVDNRYRIDSARRLEQAKSDQNGFTLNKVANSVRIAIGNTANSRILRNNKIPYLGPFIRLPSIFVAEMAQEKLGDHLDTAEKLRNKVKPNTPLGFVFSIAEEIRGEHDGVSLAHKQHRIAKTVEQEREHIRTSNKKQIIDSFGSKPTEKEEVALNKILLKTGLVDIYAGMKDISGELRSLSVLLTSPKALQTKIDTVETLVTNNLPIGRTGVALVMIKGLAYSMVIGEYYAPNLMRNAFNIYNKVGNNKAGSAETTIKDIDILISLYALQYSSDIEKSIVNQVLLKEFERENANGKNGIEFTLLKQRELQEEALEKAFGGNRAQMRKGYAREIFSPHKNVMIANKTDGLELQARGYGEPQTLGRDPFDNNNSEEMFMFAINKGMMSRVSGMFSFLQKGTQGNKSKDKTITGVQAAKNLQKTKDESKSGLEAMGATLAKGKAFDPRRQKTKYQVPLTNDKGEITDYRYMMSEENKDNLLLRNNNISDVIASGSAHLMDKISAPAQNILIVDGALELYKSEGLNNPDAFVEVSALSSDPKIKEDWRLLPEDTKKHIKKVFGKRAIYVRNDLYDMHFGYRKVNIGAAFDKKKEERKTLEGIYVSMAETVLGKNAGNKIYKADRAWDEIIKEVKSARVIKAFGTLAGNFRSNVSQLYAMGVPLRYMVGDHREAIEGLLSYQRDAEELRQLNSILNTGYFKDVTESDVHDRIIEINDSILRNPINDLVQAGMLQTIVEDVDLAEDGFSYKSEFAESVSGVVEKIPKPIRTVSKNLYMTHDTTPYKIMHQLTSGSDFVARYVLYKHLTTRDTNQLSEDKILQKVSEAFVNYDIPTTRMLQFLNDKGIMPFTKYYLRIQKILLGIFRENPTRAGAIAALNHFFPSLTLITGSTLWNRESYFANGAFEIFDATAGITPIEMGLDLFRD